MPLFQHAVINRYITGISKPVLDEAYTRFGGYFLDPQRQRNIRDAKEEQYQEGFLRELFVQVLGYTLNPDPGFNLTTEHRNVKDSRKADGAILSGNEVKAVIELKGTEVTDLARVESQAFGYKNNQPGCRYVIVSNFEKIRFYIDNAVDHIEFNLFTLTRQEFDLLWLCFSYACLMQDLPARIREESVSRETEITRALYRDYSLFKRELHQNLSELNPQFDPLTLFKKSQKLLSRLLFLFFAEDRNLLPPNSVRLVLGDWRDLKERDAEVPLYDRFKKYFGYLNTGFKGKRYDVFAYNGGLFKPDLVLDAVRIDDELLYRHTLKLSEYDFISEIDVNILGHIFENSLNELDEIRAQLEGTPVDKAKTKRKKEGVYYTPKYITKYIVENTVGRLCREKREELAIVDEEYTDAVRRQTKTRQALLDKLTAYREWLLQLTICDPACGSGAFLNQALEFLIAEHHAVDELQSRLFGDAMVLSDLDKSILENNLYGVDLNEESVEIARLSLWLRTARPNRTLNDLSANIKVGNSLINDPAVAGDKAFDWHREFPHVFAKGGFDVVIGNPPYGVQFNSIEKMFLKTYKTFKYRFESYIYFFEKAIDITNEKAVIGYITPVLWLNLENCEPLRNLLFTLTNLLTINVIGENVFQEAIVNTLIVILTKENKNQGFNILKDEKEWHCSYENWRKNPQLAIHVDIDQIELSIIQKIEDNSVTLGSVGEVIQGITAYDKYRGHDINLIKSRGFHHRVKKDDSCGKWLNGEDISRYKLRWSGEWLSYGNWLAAPREKKYFEGWRLLFREIPGIQKRIQCTITEETNYYGHSISPFILNNRNEIVLLKNLLCIVNSKLLSWYGNKKLPNFSKDIFPKINPQDIKLLPIVKNILNSEDTFTVSADKMLSRNSQLQDNTDQFHRTLQRHFGLEDIPAKLQHWYQMSYGEFMKELQKKKVKLTLAQEAEWEPYFLAEAAKAQELKRTIDATDREIDRMVYELYGLTEEEIAIVEGRN